MTESRAAEKARKTAEKYSGAGQSFQVKYLGTQEVSSAKGDAVIADCLKELRTLFMEVASHLPKVNITLQMGGVTVTDEKSKLEFIKAPLETISYVCLDPADNSVFSLIIRSNDTISSKGLRLHAFVGHPQTAITFNHSARELFDFMARIMRAKKKLAQQEASQAAMPHAAVKPSAATYAYQDPVVVPALAPPPPVSSHQPSPQLSVPAVGASASVVAAGVADEDKRQEAVFAEWKDLEKELDSIGQELGIGVGPTTSTPTSSPPTASAVATGASVPSQLQPTPLDVLTASVSDPFNSSFFDLSFGTSQPVATTTAAAVSHDSNNQHIFNNPVFNASTDKAESTPETKMSVALPSTPESKQLTYQSRPRPKGKVVDSPIAFSPPPLSEITNGTDTGGRAVRDISLSPTREQEVKSILANTDPFQSPTTFDAFQSPPPAINGSGPFEPAPFPQTPDSSFFSFSAQDSIQLVNPLYQSPSLDGSFSAPYISPPQPLQQTAMMMQPQPPVAPSPLMPLIQPPHMITQPQLSNSANSFDGIFSPTIYSPPSTGEPLWSAQSPPEDTSFVEQRDQMFADLLPLGAHSLPDKKKEFEPQKVTSPSLAELQDKKRREQEEAFIASTSITKETVDEANKWATSSFDAVTVTDSTEVLPEPPLDRSPQLLLEDLLAPTGTTKQQNTQVDTLDDFDRAFQEASKEVQDIDSAFEVKTTVKPQPQPSTNDPFVVDGNATSPELKNAPWSTF